MSKIVEIEESKDFEQELNCDVAVLVDFWATWCYPCSMQTPILHELADCMGDKIKIVKVDVDKCQETAISYGVSSIPTLMVFKNGELKEQTVGLTEKEELKKIMEKYL